MTIENGQTAPAPKVEKKNTDPIEKKPVTNGNLNVIKKVKKVFAEPASKDDIDPIETREWIDSIKSLIHHSGSERAHFILDKLN